MSNISTFYWGTGFSKPKLCYETINLEFTHCKGDPSWWNSNYTISVPCTKMLRNINKHKLWNMPKVLIFKLWKIGQPWWLSWWEILCHVSAVLPGVETWNDFDQFCKLWPAFSIWVENTLWYEIQYGRQQCWLDGKIHQKNPADFSEHVPDIKFATKNNSRQPHFFSSLELAILFCKFLTFKNSCSNRVGKSLVVYYQIFDVVSNALLWRHNERDHFWII